VPRSPPAGFLPLWLAPALFCVLGPIAADDSLPPNLPKVKGSALPESHLLGADHYPGASARLAEQGRGLVEVAISQSGRLASYPIVVSSDGAWAPRLEGAALSYLSRLEFDVPRNWEASGGTKRRYRFSFVFLIRPCDDTLKTAPCTELAPYPADYSLTVISPRVLNPDRNIYD